MKILISGGFGAGFQTWNTEWPTLHKDRILIELVEQGKWEEAEKRIGEITGMENGEPKAYLGGFNKEQIIIEEIENGQLYYIEEYDGSEELITEDTKMMLSYDNMKEGE